MFFQQHCDKYIRDELNTRKVSIFEAVWGNLQHGTVDLSERPITINLSGISNDMALVNDTIDDELADAAKNVHYTSKVFFYSKRHSDLDDMCLADFVAIYEDSDTYHPAAEYMSEYFKQDRRKKRFLK